MFHGIIEGVPVCFRDNYEKMQAEIRLAKEELQQLEKARPSKVGVGR